MLNYIATTTFGLEASVKREVTKLGYGNIKGLDGRIDFSADISAICEANLWLRCSDRLLLKMGEFYAYEFDELFEKTKALNWEDWIPESGRFIVTGKSVKSKLFSVPACQSIVEKAIVEKLKTKYKVERFEKSGAVYKIQVAILKDFVTLTIDTTGPGLHKRGYRENSVIAPLKETLAAALIELSYFRRDRILLDPMCGSGTIPIEAAMRAKNIAPGLRRRFVSEDWEVLDQSMWKNARKNAYAAIDTDLRPQIYGSDIDPSAIETAKANAKKAGVDGCIRFSVSDIKDSQLPGEHGVIICNPPYGERIGTAQESSELYRLMGEKYRDNPNWSVYVITSDEDFERLYGKKANAKRKLFNGMIKTDYYQYFGVKPDKSAK